MKSLVLAADAQSGAVLGVKVSGAPRKGMRELTPYRGDPSAWGRLRAKLRLGMGTCIRCGRSIKAHEISMQCSLP